MDANGKLGDQIIPGDPYSQSPNGKLLWEMIERNDLIVINSLKICNGVITRRRKTSKVSEESVIDFLIISRDLVSFI